MKRAYYTGTKEQFFNDDPDKILGELVKNHTFELQDRQKNAWITQINILKENLILLSNFYIALEYSIPRMGKRVDVVIIYDGLIFVIEFKVNEKKYTKFSLAQALDYSIDLKNFHQQSHHCEIVPIVVSTEAPNEQCKFNKYADGVWHPIKANKKNFTEYIQNIATRCPGININPYSWLQSKYMPTPTIIEAAQTLYKGHSVSEISRSDSGVINLGKTSNAIAQIIDDSKKRGCKSICFVTGVPGAGKTLAGLNIANERHNIDEGEHAVFLSGNGPLVQVLQEALARNEVKDSHLIEKKITKKNALRKAKAFIQNIHHFRDDNLNNLNAPIERVVIFDEAQRAWTSKQAMSFMEKKRGVSDFTMSEPEFLVSVLDRHQDWATVVCLIGGGQEINTGEAGLPEWFKAIHNKFPHWNVYTSSKLNDLEYTNGDDIYSMIRPDQIHIKEELHLAVSIRSFRAEKLSDFITSALSLNAAKASKIYSNLKETYPITITRDLTVAKQWLRDNARGSEKYGLTAYSGAHRLKPEGIYIKSNIDPKIWFLNEADDVRAATFLEDAATEFDIQGLELDWTCVAWDPSLQINNEKWVYKKFRGTNWENIHSVTKRRYLLNAYRVLLTRARQGMILFIPKGNKYDLTRMPQLYDPIYDFFIQCGVKAL